MRLISFGLFAALVLPGAALAHDTTPDPALHCAALTLLSGEILAADGQASGDDLAVLREIAGLMLVHVDLPKNQRSDALRAYAAEFRRSHSVADISTEVEKKGDGCLADFVNQ